MDDDGDDIRKSEIPRLIGITAAIVILIIILAGMVIKW